MSADVPAERTDARVVALGGGHGLAASLAALRRLTPDLTAVVTVADNGGSSGRLREEFGILPPGDLRMALAALCGDDQWGRTWAEVLQHRLHSAGDLDGHALGNLLILTLWELLDDHVVGLEWVARLLRAQGRVLPMSVEPIHLVARVRGADPDRPDEESDVHGQVAAATTTGEVLAITLDPAEPPACPEAVEAIEQADWVVLGPGSWYTSLIPHLLVPGLREALGRTRARVVVTMNLAAQPGETDGLSLGDHLRVLRRHAPDLRIDAVLVHDGSEVDWADLQAAADEVGARLMKADVADPDHPDRHDPGRLARAYAGFASAF